MFYIYIYIYIYIVSYSFIVSNSVRVKAEEEGGNIWKDYMRRIMNEENDE